MNAGMLSLSQARRELAVNRARQLVALHGSVAAARQALAAQLVTTPKRNPRQASQNLGKYLMITYPPPLCLTRSMPTPPVMPRNESSQSFVCFFDRQGPEPGCQIQGAQKQRGRASFPR